MKVTKKRMYSTIGKISVLFCLMLLLFNVLVLQAETTKDTENSTAVCVGEETGKTYSLGSMLTENCKLTGNLNCNEKIGFRIGADNITIDGQGHTISFTGNVTDSEGFHNHGYDQVTIRNTNLVNFCFGIYFKQANDGIMANNTITYTVGSGIWLDGSSYNMISNNSIKYGDDGHGILVSTNADNNSVNHNKVTTVNGRGLSIEQATNTTLYYNSLCGNQRGDLIIENSENTTGDFNTATKTFVSSYQDKTNGSPCSHSCQSNDIIIDTQDDKLIKNAIVITSNYTFSENIVTSSGHGLVIGANNLVIDGNGFMLDGKDSGFCDDAGIQRSGIFNPGFDNITIKNLEITNFCNGIYLRGDKLTGDYVFENNIHDCEIHHNGNNEEGDTSTHGIKLEYVQACTITNCSIHHNMGRGDSCESGGNGIFLYGSENNYIYNNQVFDNAKGGIFNKMKSSFNKISYNTISGNGQGGVILRCKLSRFSLVDNNNIEGNEGPGIYVGGPQNTVSYNQISSNKDTSTYNNDASIADGIRISREADFTKIISNNISGHSNDIFVKEDLKEVYGVDNMFNSSKNYKESWGMQLEKVQRKTNSDPALPMINPTPLMATVLVFFSVGIVGIGFLQRSGKYKPKAINILKWKK